MLALREPTRHLLPLLPALSSLRGPTLGLCSLLHTLSSLRGPLLDVPCQRLALPPLSHRPLPQALSLLAGRWGHALLSPWGRALRLRPLVLALSSLRGPTHLLTRPTLSSHWGPAQGLLLRRPTPLPALGPRPASLLLRFARTGGGRRAGGRLDSPPTAAPPSPRLLIFVLLLRPRTVAFPFRPFHSRRRHSLRDLDAASSMFRRGRLRARCGG